MLVLHKISLGQEECKFEPLGNGIYELLFEHCVSKLDLSEFDFGLKSKIKATSYWAETGEEVKDTVTFRKEVESPNFPSSEGFRVLEISWDSGGAIDNGYLILTEANASSAE
ncbi:hypothetical protein BGP77_12030 [Saccharospirillum sp. MSK14-1]|uniref:hypothetical protein n=1 Tax=Saccharospirillum sp. MSK14-1 TaxID=1897632 RepID=UPI000D34F245|nr:hypothetical protein [Saccharospirillum sp. MSK14-1]PTY38433.1 hypothetical protein BGP77_12030 [Saccharospirillum sp. MSK14-1]